jgi:hypothetical protein
MLDEFSLLFGREIDKALESSGLSPADTWVDSMNIGRALDQYGVAWHRSQVLGQQAL